MVDDLKPRYTTKRLRQEIERARENDARHIAALEAQLAERVMDRNTPVQVYIEHADHTVTTTLQNAIDDMKGMRDQGWDLTTEANFSLAISALEATPPMPKVTEVGGAALVLNMDEVTRTLQNAVSPYIARLGEAVNKTIDAAPASKFPPEEGVPHRWECEFPGGSFFVDTKAAADVHEAQGAKITPLYVSQHAPKVTEVRPLDDWHEDYGDVVWWARLEGEWIGEAAWIGTPNDSDWPGYHTHWSPHPPFPAALTAAQEAGKP